MSVTPPTAVQIARAVANLTEAKDHGLRAIAELGAHYGNWTETRDPGDCERGALIKQIAEAWPDMPGIGDYIDKLVDALDEYRRFLADVRLDHMAQRTSDDITPVHKILRLPRP